MISAAVLKKEEKRSAAGCKRLPSGWHTSAAALVNRPRLATEIQKKRNEKYRINHNTQAGSKRLPSGWHTSAAALVNRNRPS